MMHHDAFFVCPKASAQLSTTQGLGQTVACRSGARKEGNLSIESSILPFWITRGSGIILMLMLQLLAQDLIGESRRTGFLLDYIVLDEGKEELHIERDVSRSGCNPY
jgi:hypothetical protein